MTPKLKTEIVIDSETTSKNPHDANLLGVSIFDGEKASYIHTNYPPLKDLSLIGQNIKYDLIVLSRQGLLSSNSLPPLLWDTMIAEYLLNIKEPRKLEKIVQRRFGIKKDDLLEVYNKAAGTDRKTLPLEWYKEVPEDQLAKYAQEDVEYTHKIYDAQKEDFKKHPDLYKWFKNIELPLVEIITKCELTGVKIDAEKMNLLRNEVLKLLESTDQVLKFIANTPDLNINSSQQIRKILYEKLRLPEIKRTKTGISTDAKVLKQLVTQTNHAFPTLLLKHREYEKLLNTFIEPLLLKQDSKGRIHPTFNQALTRTRRFSCENPNLQQIPSRSELGKKVKACFVPAVNHKFLIADYSQMEPRILAHLTEDPFLLDTYKNNEDLYTKISDALKKKRKREITRDMAKILVLSILYGKTAFGLAKDWACSKIEAQGIINDFLDQVPQVKQYMKDIIYKAKENNSWLKSVAGLPLYIGVYNLKGDLIGDVNSHDQMIREAAARECVNYPIQASSQDILKSAIVNIYQKFNLVPVLMVHDELVYELHESLIGDKQKMGDISSCYSKVITSEMENAWKLKVPLKVEAHLSDVWDKN